MTRKELYKYINERCYEVQSGSITPETAELMILSNVDQYVAEVIGEDEPLAYKHLAEANRDIARDELRREQRERAGINKRLKKGI